MDSMTREERVVSWGFASVADFNENRAQGICKQYSIRDLRSWAKLEGLRGYTKLEKIDLARAIVEVTQ
jgi:hypothetical protein